VGWADELPAACCPLRFQITKGARRWVKGSWVQCLGPGTRKAGCSTAETSWESKLTRRKQPPMGVEACGWSEETEASAVLQQESSRTHLRPPKPKIDPTPPSASHSRSFPLERSHWLLVPFRHPLPVLPRAEKVTNGASSPLPGPLTLSNSSLPLLLLYIHLSSHFPPPPLLHPQYHPPSPPRKLFSSTRHDFFSHKPHNLGSLNYQFPAPWSVEIASSVRTSHPEETRQRTCQTLPPLIEK
jgi:hypothetical protein